MPRRARAASTGGAGGGLKAGWLTKKGQLNKAGKKRWFVLRPGLDDAGVPQYDMTYYKGPDSVTAAGQVILVEGGYSVRAPAVNSEAFELEAKVEGKARIFQLAAATAEGASEWVELLQGLTFGRHSVSSDGPLDGGGEKTGSECTQYSSDSPRHNTSRRPSISLRHSTSADLTSGLGHSTAGSMVKSIFEMLSEGKGILTYADMAKLGKARARPITRAQFDELKIATGTSDVGLDVHNLAAAYFYHSLGDCVHDFECLLKDCDEAERSQVLKDKAKKSKAATKAPRKQLDLGRITPDALMEQRSLLERRVLDWLKDIPIGGAEERRELPSSRAVFPSSPP
eukprot:COSAG05_NODE_34_length_27784_cov_62.890129_14_plen_341_part_00